ncbi:MAG: hypothetical protein ACI8PT_004002, partial [Gammaproteobacteria bacterium]
NYPNIQSVHWLDLLATQCAHRLRLQVWYRVPITNPMFACEVTNMECISLVSECVVHNHEYFAQ